MNYFDKLIKTTIGITDFSYFSSDPEGYMMEFLKNEYEKRNFSGLFIDEILGIKKFSDCKMQNSSPTIYGCVSVQFLARTVRYSSGDIISPVQLIKKSTLFIGKYKNKDFESSVIVKDSDLSEVLHVGDSIVCVINEIIYTPMRKNSKIIVTPLLPKYSEVYKIVFDEEISPPVSNIRGKYIDAFSRINEFQPAQEWLRNHIYVGKKINTNVKNIEEIINDKLSEFFYCPDNDLFSDNVSYSDKNEWGLDPICINKYALVNLLYNRAYWFCNILEYIDNDIMSNNIINMALSTLRSRI